MGWAPGARNLTLHTVTRTAPVRRRTLITYSGRLTPEPQDTSEAFGFRRPAGGRATA
jgi:hypothetical protein